MSLKNKIFIGIDVSKATLDISLSDKHFQINNTNDAISFFINEEIICKKIVITLVCLESTGGYETVALQCFHTVGIPIHRAHPNRVHSFAKASGHFAKTDKLDAKLLEKYAAFVCNEEKGDEPISEASYELQALRSVERNLMEDLHACRCRIKNNRGKAADHIQSQIEFIQNQLKKVRKDIEETINSDDQLKQTRELLMSHKGIAQQISNTLVAELPELGSLSNKEVASLVGVVPKTYESGMKKLNGHIMGGRFYVRKALYMAALVASRYDIKMRMFYNHLVAAGKAKKVALVAVMRKIIICLNAMVKNNKVYNELVIDI
jgi:transposase